MKEATSVASASARSILDYLQRRTAGMLLRPLPMPRGGLQGEVGKAPDNIHTMAWQHQSPPTPHVGMP